MGREYRGLVRGLVPLCCKLNLYTLGDRRAQDVGHEYRGDVPHLRDHQAPADEAQPGEQRLGKDGDQGAGPRLVSSIEA
jgi:hypothetical protein